MRSLTLILSVLLISFPTTGFGQFVRQPKEAVAPVPTLGAVATPLLAQIVDAPRTLNAPIGVWFSCLTYASQFRSRASNGQQYCGVDGRCRCTTAAASSSSASERRWWPHYCSTRKAPCAVTCSSNSASSACLLSRHHERMPDSSATCQ